MRLVGPRSPRSVSSALASCCALFGLALLATGAGCNRIDVSKLAPPSGAANRLDAALLERAESGDAESQYPVGVAIETMKAAAPGATKESSEAEKASAAKTSAWYQLGELHRLGRGVESDPGRAVGLFRRAADAGHTDAAYALAVTHEQGFGVDVDEEAAARLSELESTDSMESEPEASGEAALPSDDV
jgi:TPR repeat protein